jgi:hypothetical protein
VYVHPKLRDFDDRLSALFREVDRRLEDRWGDAFDLHPNRPRRGQTANPEADGLFEVAADFTPGIGSVCGRGYIVALRVATLERVPSERFEEFMEEAARTVLELLSTYFPERELTVVRDGARFKIVGDFSLGEA